MKNEKGLWREMVCVILKIMSHYMSGGAEENNRETLVRVTAVRSEGTGSYVITNNKKTRETVSDVSS